MRIPIVHLVVACLTECYKVPCLVSVFLIGFRRKDMVNMGTFPKSPVPLALLAHVFISPEYCLSQIVPSLVIVIHGKVKGSPRRSWTSSSRDFSLWRRIVLWDFPQYIISLSNLPIPYPIIYFSILVPLPSFQSTRVLWCATCRPTALTHNRITDRFHSWTFSRYNNN